VQVEGFRQMQSRFVERQAVDGGPEIQDVTLGRTICLETLANVVTEVNRKGALAIRRLAMHGTGAAALLTAAAEWLEEAQVAQQLLHGDLLAHEGKVDLGPSVGGLSRRWLLVAEWAR
jgi:hypothetical protein